MAHSFFRNLKLDNFQIKAFNCIDNRESLIVSAPTGSGKTLLVDYAIEKVLENYTRLIYTSPIKALSNQKFRDFSLEYGKNNVGILTGDISINRNAPILIMTTEILRNMLYLDPKGSELIGLGYVIFDEIHYINDPTRGVVWEESLILLPENVPIMMLSATIPNAEDAQHWMETIKKKPFTLIKHHIRPVPLELYYYNGFLKRYNGTITLNLKELKKLRKKQKNQRKYKKGRKKEDKVLTVFGNDFFSPVEIVESLNDTFFPIIYFIFSRKACEKSAKFISESGLNLVTKQEIKSINSHIEEYSSNFSAIEDLEQIQKELRFVQKGIAFHHAGCIPVLKEFVETLFAKGLIKVLFATETFAMGLNLPAKTVIFHSIEKFDGFVFRLMMAGEFSQMAGRAGRRGIDTYGNAILVHNLKADEEEIINIFDGDPEPLESQFRLSYNSICNLLQGRDMDEIIKLLKSSFKEYTAEIVRESKNEDLKKQYQKIKLRIDNAIECTKGIENDKTFEELEKFIGLNREYRAFHNKIKLDTNKEENKSAVEFIWNQKLVLGRIVSIPDKKGSKHNLGVIIGQDREKKIMNEENFFPTIILNELGHIKRYLPHQYNLYSIIYPFNKIKPHHYNLETKSYIHLFEDIHLNINQTIQSNAIDEAKRSAESILRVELEERGIDFITSKYSSIDEYQQLAVELEAHPCYKCEFLNNHRDYYYKIRKEKSQLQLINRKIRESENLSYAAFKKMISVLEDLKFVKNNELESKGYILSQIHHDNDILIAELINRKIMIGLKSHDLVALFAMLSLEKKESRSFGSFERTPRINSRKLLNIYNILKKLDSKIISRENARKVPDVNITRGFSLRLVELARLWSLGIDLDELTPLTTMSEGDIVNHLRRVLNLMTQVKALLFKVDAGIPPELFDKAILSLKRSHVVPLLEENMDFDDDNEISSEEEDDYQELKLR